MTGADILDSRYAWLRLGVSLLVATVGNVGIWVVVLIMPAVQAEFGIDRAQSALPYTLTMLGFAFGNFFIGRIVDRFGITVALILAALVIGASMGLAVVSPSIYVLSAMQFIVGLGTAASFGPLMADISLWFVRHRGIAVGIAASGNYLSGAVWPAVLAGVLEHSGWRAVYVALGLITLATMIPLALLLRRRVPVAARMHADEVSGRRSRAAGFSPRALMLMLALAGVGCCVAMAAPQVHIVSLATDLGFGAAVGGHILAMMLLGGAISRLVFGLVADRLGGMRTLLLGTTLQCLTLFLYLPADGMVSLFVVSTLFGLVQGGIVSSYALVVREYMPSAEAGRRVGFVLMGTILGMALGAWLSGWIHDVTGGYRMAFINGIAWNLLNIGILATILLRTRVRRPVRAGAA